MNHIRKFGESVVNMDNLNAGVTQSEITTWDNCAEKWYLGYNHLLGMKGSFQWYNIYGHGFHSTVEHFYKTGGELKIATLQFPKDTFPTAEEEATLDKWQQVLNVQMEHYAERHMNDFDLWDFEQTEEIFRTEFKGIPLVGKIDIVAILKETREKFIWDHKSSGRFEPAVYSSWEYRFQFMFYLWLAAKVLGGKINHFLVNGLQKPALRQGKAESVGTYCGRIRSDMILEPDKYFKRFPLECNDAALERFEKRVLMPKIYRIRLLTQGTDYVILESLIRNQNTDHCVKFGKTCQFMPICKNGWDAEGFAYTPRINKHEEISGEE